MNLFEYKKVASFQTEQDLNQQGKDGWELCCIDSTGDYVFKRQNITFAKPTKVTDTESGEETHFPTLSAAAESLNSSTQAMRYCIKHKSLYLYRYKIEEDI